MVERDFLRLYISKVIFKVSLACPDKVVIFTPHANQCFFYFITFAYKLLYWIDIIGKILYQSNPSIKLIILNLT